MRKETGFTLIELMIVVIIMGLLSAIAIPKMFGLSSKAKVTEVLPVIAGFEHLQKAYISEASGLGTLASIGFSTPTDSKNFAYVSESLGSLEAYLTLNLRGECTVLVAGKGNGWKTEVLATGVSNRVNANGACGELTPAFE